MFVTFAEQVSFVKGKLISGSIYIEFGTVPKNEVVSSIIIKFGLIV